MHPKPEDIMQSKVTIEICNSWGYYPRLMYVESILAEKYPDLDFEDIVVKGWSGTFKITLTKNGKSKVIHSKLNGDGFVTPSNLNEFLAKFEAAYSSM